MSVRLASELAGPAARQVRDALLDLLKGRPERLLVDMAEVAGLDERGIGALLIAALWARKFSAEFALIPSQTVRDRLTTARLDRYLTVLEPGSA